MKSTTDHPKGITHINRQIQSNTSFNKQSNISNLADRQTTIPGTMNTLYGGNNKNELNTYSSQYAITQNNDLNTNPNYQSPKLRVGKSRPGTSIGFSKNDVNPKFVNLDGVKTNPTYERETMHTLYGQFLKRPKNTFTDFREEEMKIKQKRAESSYGKSKFNDVINNQNTNSNHVHIDKFYPLDGKYFPTFHNEYTRLLTEAQNEVKSTKQRKAEIKVKSINSKILSTDRLTSAQPISNTSNRLHTINTCDTGKKKNYYESDIFNLNDRISSEKSAEKYTINKFKNIQKPYTVSSKSNSEWKASTAHPSLLGHTNSNYHILNPCIKNIAKTKNEILESQSFNPFHRQKMLSEYIDITRVGCPNPSQNFRKTYTNNKFLFNRTSDLCTKFLDTHNKHYKTICSAPFKK